MTTFPLASRAQHRERLRQNLNNRLSVMHDSPGGDVMDKYPSLPENEYRRTVHNAIMRQTAFPLNPPFVRTHIDPPPV